MFPVDRMPTFKFDTAESVDQEKMVKVLSDGVAIGMEIDVAYAHEVLQIPRAGKDAKLLTTANIKPTQEAAALSLAALSANRPTYTVDGLTNTLASSASAHEEAILQQIYACIAESGDYDEAVEKIGKLNIDLSKFAELIGQGMAAADLAGRSDVVDRK